MYVIEGLDAEGRIADVYVSGVIHPVTETVRPLKSHFEAGRARPWSATMYDTIEEATEEAPDAVRQWQHPEYIKYEGVICTARIMPLNPNGDPRGYVIRGTSDEEIAARWYAEYRQAFKDWTRLLSKTNKHRGETPNIEIADGAFLNG